MEQNDKIQLFEDKRIRTAWDEEHGEWYFSVVDVVGVLTDQPDVRHASTYWAILKKRMIEEGANELLTNCKQFICLPQTEKGGQPATFQENLATARAGGQVAGRTRKDIESQTDTPVITSQNAAQLNQVMTDMIEGVTAEQNDSGEPDTKD